MCKLKKSAFMSLAIILLFTGALPLVVPDLNARIALLVNDIHNMSLGAILVSLFSSFWERSDNNEVSVTTQDKGEIYEQ